MTWTTILNSGEGILLQLILQGDSITMLYPIIMLHPTMLHPIIMLHPTTRHFPK